MNENLKIYKDLYGNAAKAKDYAQKLFLEKAFENRTEYALPMWLQQDKRDAGESINAWCPYRHDGAFISIGKVKVQRGKYGPSYLISGYEDMEFSEDYMTDVETYDTDAVAAFILEYLDSDMDDKLADLAKSLKGLTSEDDDIIMSKADDLLSGASEPEPSEILQWAKEFVPFSEKKTRKVKVEWDTDGEPNNDLPSIVEIPDSVSDEEISDWLSDHYGFCHKGYEPWSDKIDTLDALKNFVKKNGKKCSDHGFFFSPDKTIVVIRGTTRTIEAIDIDDDGDLYILFVNDTEKYYHYDLENSELESILKSVKRSL